MAYLPIPSKQEKTNSSCRSRVGIATRKRISTTSDTAQGSASALLILQRFEENNTAPALVSLSCWPRGNSREAAIGSGHTQIPTSAKSYPWVGDRREGGRREDRFVEECQREVDSAGSLFQIGV